MAAGPDRGSAPRSARRRPAAMADVARLAGVSHQTVSRVINGSDRVAPGTRERVREAMRLLDYRPNSVARALVTGRSRTVGVIGFNTTLFGPASTLFGIERSAHEADYLTSVVSMPELDRDSVLLAVERLRRHNVEGVLALAAESTATAALRPSLVELSLVALEAEPVDGIPTVAIDQYGGAVRRPAICSSSATGGSRTSPARRARWRRSCGSPAAATRSPRPAAAAARRCSATGAPAAAMSWAGRRRRPGDHRDLRRQRPDGARRAARAARGRSTASPTTSASSASTRCRRRVLHAAADDDLPGLHRDRQARLRAAAPRIGTGEELGQPSGARRPS